MQRMPEELQHPFEDFLIFARELDESDLDAIVADFVALVKQFKVKLPKKVAELREKGKQGSERLATTFRFRVPILVRRTILTLTFLATFSNPWTH